MAVKPITNPYPKSQGDRAKGSYNRSSEISADGFKNRDIGNSRESVMIKDFTKNYAITLKDIDTTLMGHLKNIMTIKVQDGTDTIKVPVIYGNEERWKSIRKNGALRDKNGSLMLPIIVFKRTNVEMNDAMQQSMDFDVDGSKILVTRSQGWSKTNRYDRFAVQTGKKPVIERMVTGMPDFVNCMYEFVVMTNYTEQMNLILETFLYHDSTYFGDSTNYKFLGKSEGGFSDSSEMTLDTEKIIKTTFTWKLSGYILPETSKQLINGHIFEASRVISPSKVVFGVEGDATDEQVK
jgi:hypothetical protein